MGDGPHSFIESFLRDRARALLVDQLRIDPDPRGYPHHVRISLGERSVNINRRDLIELEQGMRALDRAVHELLLGKSGAQ
jgi:hypothetical protein